MGASLERGGATRLVVRRTVCEGGSRQAFYRAEEGAEAALGR
jgi:hypothetical protein